MRRAGWLLAGAAVLALGGWLGIRRWLTGNITPVQRGCRVAERHGCFTCHGPGGTNGAANPGYGLGDTPSWDGGTVMMYADTRAEIYEWIRNGMPARIRSDPASMQERAHALVRMPAWRDRISGRNLDDLVAFVDAVSRFTKPPRDSAAAKGLRTADKFGCFSCHGPMGRGCSPDPGSFKGYIPAWDGADFDDLVANDRELRDWIRDGVTARIHANPVARWFLRREAIKMPAFRRRMDANDIDALVAYIHWLRKTPE